MWKPVYSSLFLKNFLFLFLILERGEVREEERERNIDVREKHRLAAFRRPFSLHDDAQPTEERRPGAQLLS